MIATTRIVRFAVVTVASLMTYKPTSGTAAPSLRPDWDRYIQRVHVDFGNVGLAVAVVQEDKVIYKQGFGVREAGKPEPIDSDTLFQIGSTTKAFTTAALAVLVDEGKVRWDDLITKYLPDFRLQDAYVTRHLTLRDAVSHRTGVPDSYYAYLTVMTPEEVIKHLRYIPQGSEFRDSFQYNNLMYALVGKVLEAASGMSWSEFVTERLLTPLKMTRSGTSAYQYWDRQYVAPAFFGSPSLTTVTSERARTVNVAMPHGLDEKGAVKVLPWVTFDNAAPAGSIVSSASDMANWLILQANDGRFLGRQIVKKETMRELHTSQNLRVPEPRAFPLDAIEGYSMGWFKGVYHGHIYLWHGGGMLGFPAYVALLPEEHIGVVVLSNGPEVITDDYKSHRAVAFWILDRLLGAQQTDWRAEFLRLMHEDEAQRQKSEKQLQDSRLINSSPTLAIHQYAGEYEDREYHAGHAVVRADGGRLILSFGENAFEGYMEHWHADIFRLHANAGGYDLLAPEFVSFTIDPAGKPTMLSLSSPFFKLTLDRIAQ